MELNFKEWLALNEGETSAKTGLYPKGYGGIGLYPLQTYLNKSADAITYLLQDKRIVRPSDWKGTTPQHANTGEGGLFSIDHIPGTVSYPKDGNAELERLGLPGAEDGPYGYTGEKGLWDITKHLKADPQSDPRQDANTGESGKFDISRIRGIVIEPKTVDGKPWNPYIPLLK